MMSPPVPLTPDTIVGVNTEGKTVTLSRVLEACDEMREWLNIKLTTGAFTQRLVCELAGHWCRMPQMFGNVPILIHCLAVLDQIGAMEGATQKRAAPTKPAREFPVGPLKGLWHKHWFQESFIPTNLLLENEKNGEALLYKALNKHFGRNGWQGRPVADAAGIIAHAAVFDALENRAGSRSKSGRRRLTGEWIVFAKSGGRNIYLTLASHGETDEEILARCQSATADYPELKSVPPFSL